MHYVGFDSLSIVMLMNHAKCSRAAFYSHYKNLDELYLDHVLKFVEQFAFLLDEETIFSSPHLISAQTKSKVIKNLEATLIEIKEDRNFVIAMIEAENHQKFPNAIHHILFELYPEKSKTLDSQSNVFNLPVDLVVSFITNIIVSTVYWWLTKPNTLDHKILANTLFELITNLPFEIEN